MGLTDISTRALILLLTGKDDTTDRKELQALGERFDRDTGGVWVREGLEKQLKQGAIDGKDGCIVDCVRTKGQIDEIRDKFGSQAVHVHITADDDVLKTRYTDRAAKHDEGVSWEEASNNATEQGVRQLGDVADVVIDHGREDEASALVRIKAAMGMLSNTLSPQVDVIVGGQYGSEGKGQVAAYLAPEYGALLRVGGPNAGHSVLFAGKKNVFRHVPSGAATTKGIPLYIGAGAVINPEVLAEEITLCGVDPARVKIDPQAAVITPKDRAREAEIRSKMGSTASGAGEALVRKIQARGVDLPLARNCPDLKRYVLDNAVVDELERHFRNGERVLLEGTQGTALSLHHGSYPHVTSRDTAVSGCLAEAGISPRRVDRIIMLVRSYPIRVPDAAEGTSGPMMMEIDWETVSRISGISLDELKTTELTSTTKGLRRVGQFDWALFWRSCMLNSPTDICLTFADYLPQNSDATRFDQLNPATSRFIHQLEMVARAPVTLVSKEFGHRKMLDRRTWQRRPDMANEQLLL